MYIIDEGILGFLEMPIVSSKHPEFSLRVFGSTVNYLVFKLPHATIHFFIFPL